MPESSPRRGSARLRALLKNLHHQTWELELLISGLVAFALFQLPGPLAQLQRTAMVRASDTGALILTLVMVFLKMALYVLLVAFVLHLVVRAFWVGLVGLDSVFPRGARLERLPMGPMLRDVSKSLPSVRQLMIRADAVASVIFAGAFALVIIFVMALPSYGSILLLGFGVALLIPGRQTVMQVFWGVWGVFMVVAVLPPLLDRVLGDRLSPDGLLRRSMERMHRFFQTLSGYRVYGPVQLTLSSHVGSRLFTTLFGGLFVVLMGYYVVSDVLLLQGRGTLIGSPFVPTQAGSVFVHPDHYSEERDPRRGRLDVPSIPDRVVTEPFLPLFVPYRPASMDEEVREYCPGVERVGTSGLRMIPTPRNDEATREREELGAAALACISGLWTVTLDGLPVAGEPVFTQEPETGIYGLLYMIPADGLEIGRHTLVIARHTPEEETPAGDATTAEDDDDEGGGRRFTILFWKGERN